MITFPNAKINIGLHITSKRPDGFHNIDSILYPLQLCDILEVLENRDDKLDKLYLTGIPVPGSAEDNICFKAVKLLRKDFCFPPVRIHLHKIIPMGAGLGGGSSDAVSCLKSIIQLYNLSVNDNKLFEYAGQLGSDCPFFGKNTPSVVIGRGDVLKDSNISLKGKYCVLVCPDIEINTAEAYNEINMVAKRKSPEEIIRFHKPENWKGLLYNDFENQAIYNHPEIEQIIQKLYHIGALYASLSGSGAAVYGIFDNEPAALSQFDGCRVWCGKLEF